MLRWCHHQWKCLEGIFRGYSEKCEPQSLTVVIVDLWGDSLEAASLSREKTYRDQVAELEMTSQTACLARDTLHEAAIAKEYCA
jgi:hypothetical protein